MRIVLLAFVLLGCGGDKDDSGDTSATGGTATGTAGGTAGATGTGGGTAGGGGHAAACAGTHIGTYDGDDAGAVTADLLADGTLDIVFGTSFGDVNAQGMVAADGTISGEYEGVTIDGNYDLTGCSGGGNWNNSVLGASGTYTLDKS